MTIVASFVDGLRRVTRAPLVLAGVLVLTFLAALPLGLVISEAITESLGASLAASRMARGVDYTWWQQFGEQASGMLRSFSPSIVGGAAPLDNLSSFLDNRPQPAAVAAAGSLYALLWIFLSGGILDRYARNRPTSGFGFFAACGGFFGRFVRLAVAAVLVYAILFGWLHAWLFDDLYPSIVHDFTAERDAFAVRALFYALFTMVFCACNLVFDYAKVRIVVEDRRSALVSIVAAWRFVRDRPSAAALYLLDGCCFVVVIAAYAALAPGARVPMWVTLVAGQVYVLARLWVKLLFYASEVAFFQGPVVRRP